MAKPVTAKRLRFGDSVPDGVPIHCCGSLMELTDLGMGNDWQCGTCHLVVVVWNGRVDLISH